MNPLSKWSLYFSLQNSRIELYFSFLFLYHVNWTSAPFDLITKSQISHPIIPWISYSHSVDTFLLFTLPWLLQIQSINHTLKNKENILHLYYIFKIIPWVGIKAFPFNYNSSVRSQFIQLLTHVILGLIYLMRSPSDYLLS